MNVAAKRLGPPLSDEDLREVAATVLIGAVNFGYITIRYEHGKPTLVERHETIRLAGDRLTKGPSPE